MVQGEIPFKYISYLELWQPLYSVQLNHLSNFEEGIMKNISVKLI